MSRHYSHGCAGFVVESTITGPTGRPITSYWSGPHGWCIGYGPLDYSTAVYASRPAARAAFERAGGVWRDGHASRRVRDVEQEHRDRGLEYGTDTTSRRTGWHRPEDLAAS